VSAPDSGQGQRRPLTYSDAQSAYYPRLDDARERHEELTGRESNTRAAAILRDRGEFDAGKLGHRLVAAADPLTAGEQLEVMALGEVLARYYRHPAQLDRAVRAGASWAEIGAARGTTADQARQDYRDCATGQRRLARDYPKFGMSETDFATAIERADAAAETDREADPETGQ
jgi:hypothetical protein